MKEKNKSQSEVKKPLRIKIKPYIIIAPVILLTIGIFVPFISSLIMSFTKYSLKDPTYVFNGLKNWSDMFSSPSFWKALLITVQYAAIATLAELLLGFGIALLLTKKSKYTQILKVALMFPLMVAPVIATLIWLLMTNNSVGIIEKFLNIFGIYGFPWSSSSSTAMFSAIIIDVWVYCPFIMILSLAGLQSLPKSPFESAMLDGGSRWFTFKNLTLPMVKPFILIALIFRLMVSIQEFGIIQSLTRGGPGDALTSLSIMAYKTGFEFSKLAKSIPYVFVLWVIVFIISNKLVKSWISVQKTACGK